MKFTFIEKKMAPSDSLRAYAEKKVSKIDRLFRTESEANVTFSTDRQTAAEPLQYLICSLFRC